MHYHALKPADKKAQEPKITTTRAEARLDTASVTCRGPAQEEIFPGESKLSILVAIKRPFSVRQKGGTLMARLVPS
jgi:hypothetical protein